MTTRRGFTLLEVMVAVVVTGVVALVVYGAAGAAIDTQARLDVERSRLQQSRALRAALGDALRNLAAPTRYGDTVLAVEVATDRRGRPSDRLSFITGGGTPPLLAGTDWRVTLSAENGGLVLVATPMGTADPLPVVARVPGAGGLRVRVARAGLSRWTEGSIALLDLPRGVELTWSSDSSGTEPPLVVQVARGAP